MDSGRELSGIPHKDGVEFLGANRGLDRVGCYWSWQFSVPRGIGYAYCSLTVVTRQVSRNCFLVDEDRWVGVFVFCAIHIGSCTFGASVTCLTVSSLDHLVPDFLPVNLLVIVAK